MLSDENLSEQHFLTLNASDNKRDISDTHTIEINTEDFRDEKFINRKIILRWEEVEAELKNIVLILRGKDLSFLLFKWLRVGGACLTFAGASIAMSILASKDMTLGLFFLAEAAGFITFLIGFSSIMLANDFPLCSLLMVIFIILMNIGMKKYYGEFPWLAEGAGTFAGSSVLLMILACVMPNSCLCPAYSGFSLRQKEIISVVLEAEGFSLPYGVDDRPFSYERRAIDALVAAQESISLLVKKHALLRNSIFENLKTMPSVVKEIITDYSLDLTAYPPIELPKRL